MLGPFGPKSDKIGAYRAAFVRQVPFEKDLSTASRVINEVVLGTRANSTRPRFLASFARTGREHAKRRSRRVPLRYWKIRSGRRGMPRPDHAKLRLQPR
jgi:hypothetical protein